MPRTPRFSLRHTPAGRSLVAAAALSAVALAAPTAAHAEWRDVGPAYTGIVSTPSFSLAPNGDMAVGVGAFQSGCCSASFRTDRTIFARPGGGTFAKLGSFSAPGITREPPHLVHAADGTLYAWWNGASETGGGIFATQQRTDGTWSSIVALPQSRLTAEGLEGATAAAVDGQGRLTVLVAGAADGPSGAGLSTITLNGSTWGTTHRLSTLNASQSRLLTGRDGKVRAVWSDGAPGEGDAQGTEKLNAATLGSDGAWGPSIASRPFGALPFGFVSALDGSVAGNGDLVVAYDRTGQRPIAADPDLTERTDSVASLRLRSGATTWDAQRPLATTTSDLNRGSVRVTTIDDGRAIATWTGTDGASSDGSPVSTFGALLTRSGASVPQRISDDATSGAYRSGGVVTATNRVQGVVTVAWKTASGRWAVRDWKPWDGKWAPISDVPSPIVSPTGRNTPNGVEMRIDELGDTVLTSQGAEPGLTLDAHTSLAVVVDDYSGPRVSDVTGPKTLTAGTAGAFSVAVKDAFSAVGATTWDFGDGSTASGTSVRHTWTTPGRYTVTATATDRWGYPSAVASTVQVAAGGTAASRTSLRSSTGSSAPLTLAAAKRGPAVRVAGIRLTPGWVQLRTSGAADVRLRIERRSGSGRGVFRPVAAVGVRTGAKGTVRVRMKAVTSGTYRVSVEAAPGADRAVRGTAWTGRVTRR